MNKRVLWMGKAATVLTFWDCFTTEHTMHGAGG